MSGGVRVGTSGWQYADWRGVVYPEGLGTGRWLGEYVKRFPTVEVNATFYRLASPTAVQRWVETAPDGFEFSLKGSRFITHRLKLNRPEAAIERYFAPLAAVLPRTAVILWQLPPGWKRNLARLDAFLTALPPDQRYAVEFRDDDWFHPDSYALLERHGVGHVWLSSSLTTRHQPVTTGDHVYLRFHGLGEETYRYDYTAEELRPWAERLQAVAADGTPAWVYFNNDGQGRAVRNAEVLIDLLGDAVRPWPLSVTPPDKAGRPR